MSLMGVPVGVLGTMSPSSLAPVLAPALMLLDVLPGAAMGARLPNRGSGSVSTSYHTIRQGSRRCGSSVWRGVIELTTVGLRERDIAVLPRHSERLLTCTVCCVFMLPQARFQASRLRPWRLEVHQVRGTTAWPLQQTACCVRMHLRNSSTIKACNRSSSCRSSLRSFASSAAAEPAVATAELERSAHTPVGSKASQDIDVARYVQDNYTPYAGDVSFLQGAVSQDTPGQRRCCLLCSVPPLPPGRASRRRRGAPGPPRPPGPHPRPASPWPPQPPTHAAPIPHPPRAHQPRDMCAPLPPHRVQAPPPRLRSFGLSSKSCVAWSTNVASWT
jgi:hypothetical protein